MRQGNLDCSKLNLAVLDEADQMLDIGFLPDIEYILGHSNPQRQTLLFSATMPDTIQRLASWALVDPAIVDTGTRRAPADTVEHAVYPVDGIQKMDLLIAMLEYFDYNSILVFTRMKREADRIATYLEGHEGLPQQRD